MKASSKICGEVFEPPYAAVHKVGMDLPKVKDVPALLQAIMDKTGWKQEGVARQLDVDQPQISRWRKGAKPNGENFEQILDLARKTGVLDDVRSEDVADSLDGPPRKTVKIKGYVGAGSETHFYRYADESFDVVDAPAGATDQTIAVKIVGKSWGPEMDGWLVFYDDIRSPVTEDLLGYACIVGLADDRILLKTPRRGPDGSINLHSNSEEPTIIDADVEWAAKVIGFRPR